LTKPIKKVKFGVIKHHNNKGKERKLNADFFSKPLTIHERQFVESCSPNYINRLFSSKNQEAYLNELRQMNKCEECNKALQNSDIICPDHGHHHHFTKTLASTLN
jgi:hypothetical protein